MADGFRTFFKDAVVPQASEAVKPNLGNSAVGTPDGADVQAKVPPIPFPNNTLNSLKLGRD